MNALRSVREQLEEAISTAMCEVGMENSPENRRNVLKSTIRQMDRTAENSSSITEKLWYRRFVLEAEDMFEELDK